MRYKKNEAIATIKGVEASFIEMSQLGVVLGFLVFVALIAAMAYVVVNFEGKDSSEELSKEEKKKIAKENKRRADLIKADEDYYKKIEKRPTEAEPKKESFARTTFSGGGLTSKISRLKKLYKSGTLTKAEFEKAKNNLLK